MARYNIKQRQEIRALEARRDKITQSQNKLAVEKKKVAAELKAKRKGQ